MSNPLARRLRLASRLLALREAAGLTHAALAAQAGVSTATISRLENPDTHINRKISVASVDKILRGLGVTKYSTEWCELHEHAEAGAEDGWWDNPIYARMGEGQRVAAIVEAGAGRILEYANALLPGLVQTADYARHRAELGLALNSLNSTVDVDRIVAGRLRRQREIMDAGVPYLLICEEQTIRRRSAPRPVMVDQLRHLLKLVELPNVSIQVVPVDAEIANGCGVTARDPYSLVTYPDPDDPRIVTVDTVTQTLVITDVGAVQGYAQLHERLQSAALSDDDSVAMIREAADRMAAAM